MPGNTKKMSFYNIFIIVIVLLNIIDYPNKSPLTSLFYLFILGIYRESENKWLRRLSYLHYLGYLGLLGFLQYLK